MALVALLPQAQFIYERGREWHGSNVAMHPDEVAYSAYLAALIRGRPRRNDPYTGRRDTAISSEPESLFSIQMVPAYVATAPARLLGISASTIFILLTAVCAGASTLAVFWFVLLVTGDGRMSAASTVIVLGLGTLLANQGLLRYLLTRPFFFPQWISDVVNPPSLYHLPFLRIYQPAIAFPMFFVFCALMWLALQHPNKRRVLIVAAMAGATFSLLVFSYFFLWTAAMAFLFFILTLWTFAGEQERRRAAEVLGVIGAFAIPTVATYFWFLSHRASTVDSTQALIKSRTPDLFRLSEIVALITLALLLVGIRKKLFDWRDAKVLFPMSLALTVIAVFNQQIMTGRSLQPFHYEWFIGNYCAGIALVVSVVLLDRKRKWLTAPRLVVIALLALFWGTSEVWLASSLNRTGNTNVDEGRLVASRLRDLATTDGTRGAESADGSIPIVLVADLALADRFPTDAPQAILWAPHMLIFPGVTEKENRLRFFNQLHYLGFDENRIFKELEQTGWFLYAGFFPYDRLSPVISGKTGGISAEELRAQIREYEQYSNSVGRENATKFRLSYLVVRSDAEPDYRNVDRWYERDAGEKIGKFVLYRLKLRED